ncbi:hypothetical protein NW760_005415 [Fusarium oxysporum]|nr:hypothetical protein NW769_001560 [Fusarium oxysporum]KAJ4233973.1 hypothetical protein NW760_005415 [Fusarium oxysporum]
MEESLNFHRAVKQVQGGKDAPRLAQTLLQHLTQDEKLGLLHGDPPFWKGFSHLFGGEYTKRPYSHGKLERLGIPGVQYCDGPRGVNINQATVFPCSTARGATWDIALEESVARAIGREARVFGANCVGSVCVNLPRHPAWGRVQETYGEDPLHLGEFGAAHVRGLQENVMACVKHFALNSMETARFRVNVSIDACALHEVYLPHFKQCIDAGALSIMTAYNSINGEWAGESVALIRNILRERWSFSGIVITDWLFGLRDGVKSVKADLDIECPFQNRRQTSLRPALESGEISWSDIDRIASRIIQTQLTFYANRQSVEPERAAVFGREHRELARTVASRAIVLLKNGLMNEQPLLPLSQSIKTCAIVGRHADSALTGDRASSWVHCPEVISPYQGLKEQLPHTSITLSASRDIRAAVEAARKSEVAIVMVGYDGDDEGEFLKPSWENDGEALALLPQPDGSPEAQRVAEGRAKAADVSHRPQSGTGDRPEDDLASRPVGGDRRSVRLAPEDVELIRAVVKTNPRTIVSIITAGAVIIEEWHDIVPSILINWYNGCENGRALADVLAGRSNPSGHLPWSMPGTEVHLPSFDPDANQVTYDKWFGQRMLDKMGVKAAYPLGFGLSYTTFEVECIDFDTSSLDETLSLQVGARVRNTGSRLGHCVVQIYGCPDLGPGQHDFPNRLLAGFQVVELSGQETKWVQVKTSLAPFRRWEEGDLRLTARSILFQVGQYAGDQKSLSYRFHLRGAEARL